MKLAVHLLLPLFLFGTVNLSLAQDIAKELAPETYQHLKDQGLLPAGFTGGFSVASPDTKLSKKPVGKPKGGSGASCDCWIAPDASYTLAMPPNDDWSTAAIAMPFTFNLYGDLYTTVYINNNGNVSFDSPYGTFSSTGFPASGYAMVAPFWADVDTRGSGCAGPGGGEVWYKLTPTAMYVNWVAVGYYGCQVDKHNNFQLIITDGTDPVIGIGKNVSFCYGEMEWTTGSASCWSTPANDPCTDGTLWYSCSNNGGYGYGFCGTPSNVGANRGNAIDYLQFTRSDKPGVAYDGPFLTNDGVDWLDLKNFVFTTSVSTSNIPPIGSSIYLCDTIDVCVGQQVTLDFTFLSPEPGQITTGTSWATLANYTEIVNLPGNTALITGQFTPLPAEVGFQTLTFEGTDNGTPPLTATYNIVVQVFPAPATSSGSFTACSSDPPVDLLSQLVPPLAAGGDWLDPLGNPHGGTFTPGVDLPGDYNYAVGGGAGCPSTATVTASVVTAADAGLDGALVTCNSNPTSDLFLQVGGTPDLSGSWTDPFGAAFTNPLDPAVGFSGDYTYTITGTAPCPNDQSVVTVTINLAVDAGDDAVVPLCTDAAPLDMLASLGGTPDPTGNWTGPGGLPFGGTFDASVDLPGVYTYSTPAFPPCASDLSTLTITVDPLPNAGLDGVLTVCADAPNSVLFNLLGGTPDAGGSWLDPNGTAIVGLLDPSTELSGNYIYVVPGIGECDHLTDSAIVVATLNHMPEVAFSAAPLGGCDDLPVDFINSTPPSQIGTCDWDFGDGQTGNSTGNFNQVYLDPGLFDVTLTVTSPQGCAVTVTEPDYVLVTPAPVADFIAYPNPATTENNKVLLTATDPNAITWEWQIADLGTMTVQEFLWEFPNVIGGVYPVCLEVTDQWGCTDEQCNDVIVKAPLFVYVPNAFTPNGDGVNDYFFPSIMGSDPTAYKLFIFDRWGGKVFESTNQYNVWTGTYMNQGGELLASGLYAWRLITQPEDGGGKKEFMGHVSLLR